MAPRAEDEDLVIEPADDEGLLFGNSSSKNMTQRCKKRQMDLLLMSAVLSTRVPESSRVTSACHLFGSPPRFLHSSLSKSFCFFLAPPLSSPRRSCPPPSFTATRKIDVGVGSSYL
ncbi:unnamed protein product [Caenorhabditis auriculariae]|uniref:Uncharacterized protein n=1 Tax=Caenorhabditis auriculariae TaxID=2777116 RepID=A0A8S1HJ97_9PELO|nr:unnamed protein product [Caenorhabditis auriculariae]